MENYNDIQLLIDRFFKGETSMEEEKRIYAFYSSHPQQLPQKLECYRGMFSAFDAILLEAISINRTLSDEVAIHKSKPKKLLYILSGIAAAVLLCIGIFAVINIHQDNVLASNYEGSYLIVNGARITELSRIKPDIEKALKQADDIEQNLNQHSVIKKAEQNVLDNINDPKEKARILQLLNE